MQTLPLGGTKGRRGWSRDLRGEGSLGQSQRDVSWPEAKRKP